MFSALLHAKNTMKNTIDDADYIVNLDYFIIMFQWVTKFSHSHSIINKPFLDYIFNDLFFCRTIIP